MNWQDAVERTVSGLGYDLVDASKSAGGLLRVFIDHPPAANGAPAADGRSDERFITVDDCEKVTRQLQHVLEVDDVAYERLEVSSPGLDRPLKKAADFARFVGEQVELTLKLPFRGRKKFRGELSAYGEGWRLLMTDSSESGARRAVGKAGEAKVGARRRAGAVAPVPADLSAADVALDFALDEVRDAHLVPVVDFKGRAAALPTERSVPPFVLPVAGAFPNDEVDGGRIQ